MFNKNVEKSLEIIDYLYGTEGSELLNWGIEGETYTKGENGTVHVTKATRSAVIYEDVDTGLSRYPIAWGNWEKQKNRCLSGFRK